MRAIVRHLEDTASDVIKPIPDEFSSRLMVYERDADRWEVRLAFQKGRDYEVYTNKRLILIDTKGYTGIVSSTEYSMG